MNTNKIIATIFTGINQEKVSNFYSSLWNKLHESDRNNILQYQQYKEGVINLSKDEVNSLQMEIICELTEFVMEAEFGKSREDMYDKDGSYYEKYQDRFNCLYDEIEDELLNYNF